MRIFYIIGLILLIYACSNDITTLGDNLIYNENHIEVEQFLLDETSTIRLDSFPTSDVRSVNSNASFPLIIGKIDDRLTGTVTTTPYFQVRATGLVSNVTWETNCTFDSLTLNIPYSSILAGDTTAFQTFDLYQTEEHMVYNVNNSIFCDVDSLPWKKKIAQSLTIYPQQANLNLEGRLYFKLDYDFGKGLFDRMRSRDPLFEQDNQEEFMEYFKALAIVPHENNSVLMSINPMNLGLTFHYHIGSLESSENTRYVWPTLVDQRTGSVGYAYTNIKYNPTSTFKDVTFTNPMPFEENNLAVIEGLNGLMTKMQVPFISDSDPYKTILKAEIELRVNTDLIENNLQEPEYLGVYIVSKENYIRGLLSNMSGTPIYGQLLRNYVDPSIKTYSIDITDFYISQVEGVEPVLPEIYLLVGLPGSYISPWDGYQIFTGNVANTFQRVVLNDLPRLKIYYSYYK